MLVITLSGVSRLERLVGPRICKCSVHSLVQQLQERKVSSVGGAQAPLGPTVDTPLITLLFQHYSCQKFNLLFSKLCQHNRLRPISGKDLVPNHLTYFLYNHVAIWPEPNRDNNETKENCCWYI